MITSVQLGKLLVDWREEPMESLRAAVMERFASAAPVGEELAGILYGRHVGSTVQIEAWRAIPRERTGSPALPLTDSEMEAARSLLRDYVSDVETRDCVPLGWFRSRTRGMAALSPEDAVICKWLFSEQDCLAVILRPSTQRPVIASFFWVKPGVELEASIRGTQVALEPPATEPEPVESDEPEEDEIKMISSPIVHQTAPFIPEMVTRSRQQLNLRWLFPAAAFLVGGLVSTLTAYALLDRPLKLTARVQGETLSIRWNRSVGFLSRASGAELEVAGRPTELSVEQLRTGAWLGDTPRGDFRIRMKVQGPLAENQRAVLTVVESPLRQ